MEFHITDVSIVCATTTTTLKVASLALQEITGGQWTLLTEGHQCRKRYHTMASSCAYGNVLSSLWNAMNSIFHFWDSTIINVLHWVTWAPLTVGCWHKNGILLHPPASNFIGIVQHINSENEFEKYIIEPKDNICLDRLTFQQLCSQSKKNINNPKGEWVKEYLQVPYIRQCHVVC